MICPTCKESIACPACAADLPNTVSTPPAQPAPAPVVPDGWECGRLPGPEALAVALLNVGTMSPRLRKLYADAAAVLRSQSAPAPVVPDPAMGNPISPMKPLTREQIDAIWRGMGSFTDPRSDYRLFARAAIAKFCEVNGIGTTGGGNG